MTITVSKSAHYTDLLWEGVQASRLKGFCSIPPGYLGITTTLPFTAQEWLHSKALYE